VQNLFDQQAFVDKAALLLNNFGKIFDAARHYPFGVNNAYWLLGSCLIVSGHTARLAQHIVSGQACQAVSHINKILHQRLN